MYNKYTYVLTGKLYDIAFKKIQSKYIFYHLWLYIIMVIRLALCAQITLVYYIYIYRLYFAI